VVSAALEGVWRKLMACSSPDWSKVSEVVRRLVQLAGSDAEKLRLYRWAGGGCCCVRDDAGRHVRSVCACVGVCTCYKQMRAPPQG
jgi:hypothetical protein